MTDGQHRTVRSRARTLGAVALVAVSVAVLSGCYTVSPLPAGKATHVFATQHPRNASCPTWHPPMVYVPSKHDCCVNLPSGKIDQLSSTLQRSGWFFHANSQNRYVSVYPMHYGWWYENAYTREYRVPGCYAGRDAIFYVETHPAHRYYRMTHNVELGGYSLALLSQGSGHRWNP